MYGNYKIGEDEKAKRREIQVKSEGGLLPYEHGPGDYRDEYFAGGKERWIVYILLGGSGIDIKHLDRGESWREGGDKFLRSFDSLAEAEDFVEEYMNSF